MNTQLTVSATPHVRDSVTIPVIMYSVVAALIPALMGAVYFFGLNALWLTLIAIAACVVTEGAIEKLTGQTFTMFDGSAIVTGILLAFNLPAGAPWWIPLIGGVFAVAVGKMTFGGLGYNPLNPALLGRVFLLLSWPVEMTTTWRAPNGGIDAETVATPLNVLKANMAVAANQADYSADAVSASIANLGALNDQLFDLLIGNVSGCIGETSVVLLLVGAVFLLARGFITPIIPAVYVLTVGLLTWIFGGYEGLFTGPWLFHILSGGLILGAFFMATDMVTRPITPKGQLIFGIGCGLFTVLIRLVGGYPEGVSFAILLMNLTVPLIDRYTKPTVFGEVKTHA